VDQELSQAQGNRGYLAGTPKDSPAMKETRQMIFADIELPTTYKAKPTNKVISLESLSSSEDSLLESDSEQGIFVRVAPERTEVLATEFQQRVLTPDEAFESYIVKKGESLWSIASKPEVYGKATGWKLLFDANRDLLNSPESLKAGMTLRVPRGEIEYEDQLDFSDKK